IIVAGNLLDCSSAAPGLAGSRFGAASGLHCYRDACFCYRLDLWPWTVRCCRRAPPCHPGLAGQSRVFLSSPLGMLATCLPLWFNPAVSHAGDGDILFAHACKLGCEGIVSKRLWLVPIDVGARRIGSR